MSQFESPEVRAPSLFVVTGAGPVGWTVAEKLAAAGHRVRVLTRSESGPDHPLIEKKAVDVSDAAQLGGLFRGAKAVFHCIHGSKYSAQAWAAELPGAEQAVLAAAGEAGAVVVFPESLYSYSAPEKIMAEDSPRQCPSRSSVHASTGRPRNNRVALFRPGGSWSIERIGVTWFISWHGLPARVFVP